MSRKWIEWILRDSGSRGSGLAVNNNGVYTSLLSTVMNLAPLEPQILYHTVGTNQFCKAVVVISAMIYFSVVSLPLLSCPSEEVEGS